MIERTQEEVENFLEELWGSDVPPYVDCTVAVKKVKDGWDINAKQMYEYLPLSLKTLIKIAEFFGTMKIDDNKTSWGGCETCDYGSSYEIDLAVRE